ncbi:carbohydrate ABC transporter permease [Pseudoroseicyclus aestuarii]|uniref:Carbohydrate ABC transporter membrane protein 1 (CUT1 family) n=1 Tax=Pseudoroseicyclus aestuarii TaxID=1795041 RepID=A0A318SUH1_9RHOB|nr:sugar ABC transporter permease [Pseudoroseicyclus aestuarii]PYE85551.1 carbohydrate ABC transporter membrane protein 1 (CUT1 family) [Pseudoroseicyclus aestuarii]
MPHRSFLFFILPSAIAMILFIALPIGSVLVQSLFVEHGQILHEVETCSPFGGCTTETRVDAEATNALRAAQPLGRFNGLGTYLNRNHLATGEIAAFWSASGSWGQFWSRVSQLPFYRALGFTIAYTLVVTPCGIALGFWIALAVNRIPKVLKGPVIFVSLLPMIITPLIGSLVLYWMLNSRGILGRALQWIADDPTLSIGSSGPLTWAVLFLYGIWIAAPFSFVVFYAGLQTVPQDTLESAMIDGASRWERVRFVVIPHLVPLATFVALVQLMDNFRVLEPIVGFNAQARATSLSFIIFNDLKAENGQLFGSAAATSMMTILFVVILLMPVLIRTWRDFSRKPA